jgi:GMP reductase
MIAGGLRSMMTYIGAKRLKEVPKRTTFVLVGAQRNNAFDNWAAVAIPSSGE